MPGDLQPIDPDADKVGILTESVLLSTVRVKDNRESAAAPREYRTSGRDVRRRGTLPST
jgi:hypothetical protein